ncbi:short chain dehydrogenase, partial [Kibdelosporangium lantanae]
MTDRYQRFTRTGPGKFLVSRLGLPNPVPLRRYVPGEPPLPGPAVVGAAKGSRLEESVRTVLKASGIETVDNADRAGALVFDATGIDSVDRLRELYDFFHSRIRCIAGSGRVVVLGTTPDGTTDTIAQRALEGFTRSVGKELKRGAT